MVETYKLPPKLRTESGISKAKKRYSKDPDLQISKDVMVGLPTMATVAAISDKRNYKNKTKPKKEKYNPRLKVKKKK